MPAAREGRSAMRSTFTHSDRHPSRAGAGRLLRHLLGALFSVAALAALSACGGGGGGEAQPTEETPEGDTPGMTATAPATQGELSSMCDVAPPDDVEDALGESVGDPTVGGALPGRIPGCQYRAASGIALNVEPSSAQDFESDGVFPGANIEGEPVPGVGDEAAWFFQGALNVLSVRRGDFYFRITIINPPEEEVDSASQLAMARNLAIKVAARVP